MKPEFSDVLRYDETRLHILKRELQLQRELLNAHVKNEHDSVFQKARKKLVLFSSRLKLPKKPRH